MTSGTSTCDRKTCCSHDCGCTHDHAEEDLKKTIIRVLMAGVFVFIAVLTEYTIIPLQTSRFHVCSLALTAYPIIKEAILGIEKRMNVSTWLPLLCCSGGYWRIYVAADALILTIGELVEDYLFTRTKKDLNMMVQAAPTTASLILNEKIHEIPVEDIRAGDQLMIHPGERIPVDGYIVTGHSDVDESFRTGESLPINKKPGDAVYSEV